MNSDGISFNELFDKFLLSQECDNRARDTLLYYQRCYKSFANFFNVNDSCSLITDDLIIRYKYYLRNEREIKDVTINTELRGLRAILYFGMEKGYIKKFKVKIPKVVTEVKELKLQYLSY